MKGSLWSVCFILLSAVSAYCQQNIQFTQYIFNALSVNPAYAGYKEEWFGQLGLRSQWAGWRGAPKTGSISLDGVLDDVQRRHGVGVQVIGDQLGAQSAVSVYGHYALRLQLDPYDRQRLSLGVAAGFTQYGLDGNKLEDNDKGDESIPLGVISTWKPDIRLGVYYSNPTWYAGVSVQDLFAGTESDQDFQFSKNATESIYRKVQGYFIFGLLLELERDLLLRPSLLVKDDFRGPTAMDINAMFIFNDRLWLGAGYRMRARVFSRDYSEYTVNKLSALNAISGIAQFYLNPKFAIGYSYDHMLNKMAGLQSGTHELTLGVKFGQHNRRIVSPRFF